MAVVAGVIIIKRNFVSYGRCLLGIALCPLSVLDVAADELDRDISAGVECRVLSHETALDSELGSAGIMKNIAEHPESIRAVAVRLLTRAVQTREVNEPPECRSSCADTPRSEVVYRVEPTVFLVEDKQQALCLNLEKQTKSNPLHFGNKEFDSLDKLNDWIAEFSQGRGDDGKILYEQCGGNCSPRYTFYIAKNEKKLSVRADTVCGLARDKKSDQYIVSTAIRWHCAGN